jgi:hypothetical protein
LLCTLAGRAPFRVDCWRCGRWRRELGRARSRWRRELGRARSTHRDAVGVAAQHRPHAPFLRVHQHHAVVRLSDMAQRRRPFAVSACSTDQRPVMKTQLPSTSLPSNVQGGVARGRRVSALGDLTVYQTPPCCLCIRRPLLIHRALRLGTASTHPNPKRDSSARDARAGHVGSVPRTHRPPASRTSPPGVLHTCTRANPQASPRATPLLRTGKTRTAPCIHAFTFSRPRWHTLRGVHACGNPGRVRSLRGGTIALGD